MKLYLTLRYDGCCGGGEAIPAPHVMPTVHMRELIII